MHGAAANGANGVVRLLAEKGANLNPRDKYQQTPLSAAAGERLPWIPNGDELGEIMQPSTRDLLLKLGATPLNTPATSIRRPRIRTPTGSTAACAAWIRPEIRRRCEILNGEMAGAAAELVLLNANHVEQGEQQVRHRRLIG